MSHFIRKTVLEKEIYEVDLEPLRDLYETLSVATNKINQIAKRVNQTGVIYKSDIDKKDTQKLQNSCPSILRRTPPILLPLCLTSKASTDFPSSLKTSSLNILG